jgi:hypothetical protein
LATLVKGGKPLRNLVRGCWYLMKQNKVKIIFFPFYFIYIFIFFGVLGISHDIWDDVIRKMEKK